MSLQKSRDENKVNTRSGIEVVVTSRTRNAVVRKRARGFKSHPLRHKRCFVRFFAETALFAAFLPPLTWQHFWLRREVKAGDKRLGRAELRRVVQMRVNVGRGREIAVTEPLLYLLHRYAVGEQQTGAAMT